MKRRALCIVIMMILLIWQAPATASEVDILVRKMVEKGLLNKQDADAILKETKTEAAKERTETVAATKEALMTGKDAPFVLASALPAWVKNTTLKGDMRLRYQYTDRENADGNRNRGRYRLRLAVVTKLNEKVDVGFGLATGDGNPRSAVEDMNNSFEKAEIDLDLAYVSYKPFKWLQLIGGKIQNPLFVPGGSFLWDSDIRPEGVSAVMQHKVGGVELFMNSGFWILDEYSDSSDDPMMWVAQPGYKVNLGKKAYFKNALTVYQFSNVKGAKLDYTSKSNTVDAGGFLEEDYDAAVLSGELGYQTSLALIPFAALYGEYVNNIQTSSKDGGYLLGVKFGHDKVAKKHQWQTYFHYQRLEQDSWLDIFPDADVYGGKTNTESYRAQFTYGLMDNIDFTTIYYYSEPLTGSSDTENNLIVEVNFKF